MLKKLIAATLASASILAAAGPAAAFDGGSWWDFFQNDFEVSVHNENILVETEAIAIADTGNNEQEIEGSAGGGGWWSLFHDGGSDSEPEQTMSTGDADARTEVSVDVASTLLPLCGCLGFDGDMTIDVHNEDLWVGTSAMAGAYTGDNKQEIEPSDQHSGNHIALLGGGDWEWPDFGGSISGIQDMTTGNADARTTVDVVVAYTDFGVSD